MLEQQQDMLLQEQLELEKAVSMYHEPMYEPLNIFNSLQVHVPTPNDSIVGLYIVWHLSYAGMWRRSSLKAS